jgi:hypothetical protein
MQRDYDCVELVRTERRRGALQDLYRATARPTLDEGQRRALPSSLRRELSGETLAEVVEDVRAASEAGARPSPRDRRAHPPGIPRARVQEAQPAARARTDEH